MATAAAAAEGSSAEGSRLARNQLSWDSCTGYETSSGCPCWDASSYPCIPKGRGWGYNPNFYACLCCCLCDRGRPASAQPPPTGAARE